MVKCSFCGHGNEDGVLFCDKCKTDLSIPAPAMSGSGADIVLEAATALPDGEFSETLHLARVPMVENLGAIFDETGDLTRLAPALKEPFTPPLAESTPGSGSLPAPSPLGALSSDAKPRLVVLRGEKVDMQYPVYPGKNYLGRTDEKPVDIDLENQEPADRIWTSRQHAVVTFENGLLTVEDLNSLNGTFVNRTRVHPGQVRTLQVNDIVQVGTVHMRVILG